MSSEIKSTLMGGRCGGEGNSRGTLFTLPLTDPFDVTTTNLTSLFSRNPEPDDVPVNFQDGTMFSTDNEFLLFGGVARLTNSGNVPGAQDLLGYERYQWGPYRSTWHPSFTRPKLPSHMTRYITHGAGVSVASESLGFYFGGMRGPNWGPITSHDASANTSASTLISVSLSTMSHEAWTNMTLPNEIPTRANAQMVWLPISAQGALAVIGGVPHPENLYPGGLSETQAQENNETGSSFLVTIPIYDIANKQWYLQNTTGDPPPRARSLFCTELASAPDGSSHNIYLYGGYDGTDAEQTPYDDVYILSLPSFTWFRAYTGSPRHGRSGHQCIKVFPDQMLVLGGRFKDPTVCLDGGVVQVFNLNTLQFQNSYSPDTWSDYRVPKKVVDRLGGSSRGGASRTAPDEWSDQRLASLFNSTYTKTITTWYPYRNVKGTPHSSNNTADAKQSSHSRWLVPVLLAVLIPVAAANGLLAIMCVRRRIKSTKGIKGESQPRPSCPAEADSTPVERDPEKPSPPTLQNQRSIEPPQPSLPSLPELPADNERCLVSGSTDSGFSITPTPTSYYASTRPEAGEIVISPASEEGGRRKGDGRLEGSVSPLSF
ncbi:hypothetical protein EYZ11_012036 [Aspergillus tanneri]|uniref:Kelch repeat protein n=1 Tax=Aspergillus tanneri TaxID=1220188 RepID=A0A4S3J3E0_9EURO|nr:hypothetical protein EYZ11_012036 [Aspergillus tanneri]